MQSLNSEKILSGHWYGTQDLSWTVAKMNWQYLGLSLNFSRSFGTFPSVGTTKHMLQPGIAG